MFVWTVRTQQHDTRNFAASTLPPGCYVKNVQKCIDPPCDPIVVCPSITVAKSPTSTPVPTRGFCTMDANPCNPSSCSYNPSLCATLSPTRNVSTTVTPIPTCTPRLPCMDPPEGELACVPKMIAGTVFCPKSSPTPSPTATSVVADLNADGKVNLLDFNLLLRDFGKTGSSGFIKADITNDGIVNLFDFNVLLQHFGT